MFVETWISYEYIVCVQFFFASVMSTMTIFVIFGILAECITAAKCKLFCVDYVKSKLNRGFNLKWWQKTNVCPLSAPNKIEHLPIPMIISIEWWHPKSSSSTYDCFGLNAFIHLIFFYLVRRMTWMALINWRSIQKSFFSSVCSQSLSSYLCVSYTKPTLRKELPK